MMKSEKGLAKEDDYPWRSGLFLVVKQALCNKEHLSLVQKVVHGSRCLTAPVFDFVWRLALQALEGVGEAKTCQKLKVHYLYNNQNGFIDAHWRGGKLQPGSYVGSQPQDKTT